MFFPNAVNLSMMNGYRRDDQCNQLATMESTLSRNGGVVVEAS